MKKILSLVLILTLIVSLNQGFSSAYTSDSTSPDEAFNITGNFYDMQEHWAKEYVDDLRLRGVVKGDQNHILFMPDSHITRAELTKIALKGLYIDFQSEVSTTSDSKNSFNDVLQDSWYFPYVSKAKELGIISGYDGDFFRPNDKITRAEALKILVETSSLKKERYYTELPFSDTEDDWYTYYIQFALAKKLISTDNKEFRPNDPITRAEAAKLTSKLIQLKEKEYLKYNSEIKFAESSENEWLNEKYALDKANLWRKYTNYDYGFSFYYPYKEIGHEFEDGVYNTAIYETDHSLILHSQRHQNFSETDAPYGQEIYFTFAENDKELTDFAKSNVSEYCNAFIDEESQSAGFSTDPSFTEPDQRCHSGKSRGNYNPETNVAIFYAIGEGGERSYNFKTNPDFEGELPDLTPFELELF